MAALTAIGAALRTPRELLRQLHFVRNSVAQEHIVHGAVPFTVGKAMDLEVALDAAQVVAGQLGESGRFSTPLHSGTRYYYTCTPGEDESANKKMIKKC